MYSKLSLKELLNAMPREKHYDFSKAKPTRLYEHYHNAHTSEDDPMGRIAAIIRELRKRKPEELLEFLFLAHLSDARVTVKLIESDDDFLKKHLERRTERAPIDMIVADFDFMERTGIEERCINHLINRIKELTPKFIPCRNCEDGLLIAEDRSKARECECLIVFKQQNKLFR